MRLEFDDDHLFQVRLFYALFQLFIFTMLLAVATDNLGLMWVAIEGTTLATVFLVNLHDNHTGLEAAYKYLIISSVGIALRSEEHTSELQSHHDIVCRLL